MTSLPPVWPAEDLARIVDACRKQGMPPRSPSLDMGCLEGRNLCLLPEPRVCFDISKTGLDNARRRFPDMQFSPLVAALPDIPLADGSFRTVLAWAVMYILGGVEPHKRALREIVRITQPGALFFSNYRVQGDVTMNYAGEELDYRTFRISDEAPDAQQGLGMSFWDPEEIEAMHAEAGLTVRGRFDVKVGKPEGDHVLAAFVSQRPT